MTVIRQQGPGTPGPAPRGAEEVAGLGAVPVAFFLSLMATIEAREGVARGRARAVALYAVATARELALPVEIVDAVRLGALVSNLGMLSVPDTILRKGARLTDAERETMRQHPLLGAEILANVPQFRPLLPIVLYHHEDWGGDGYPLRLRGDRIPLGARIVRVADTFDALISPRPYRAAYPAAEALAVLASGVGRQFDGRVVIALSACVRRGGLRDDVLDRWAELYRDKRDWRQVGAA